jgi:hypothetical protein
VGKESMNNVVPFRPRKPAPQAPQPDLSNPSKPSLNRLTQALQAVLFLEGDEEAAGEILRMIGVAVAEKTEFVTVESPVALKYRKYFDYAEEGWLEAHERMFQYVASM